MERGVHLHAFGQWTGFMEQADYWIPLLASMHMKRCVALSDSDAFYTSGAAEELLRAGLDPIVRFAYTFPAHFTEMLATEQLVRLYARYGKVPIIQFANEPFDNREWRNGNVPPLWEAWAIIADRWNEAARLITERGGIAGFPDGPTYGENPFLIIGDEDLHWQERKAIFCSHNYKKGRPDDYPEDDVSRFGVPLTMDEYRAELDVYADDPNWNEGPVVLAMMNAQRLAWADPNLTALDDDVCWHGWQKTLAQSREAFGFEVRIGMTEGGRVPRDRAGTGPVSSQLSTMELVGMFAAHDLDITGSGIDIRWPYSTPQKVADTTVAMFAEDTPLEFACPWLLEDAAWMFDAWVTGAYRPHYWLELPVVQALQEAPPDPVKAAAARIAAAGVRVGRAAVALGEIEGV